MRDAAFGVFLVFLLVPVAGGAGMVVAGVRMMRRPPAVHRVPIDAVVVEYSTMTRPRKVTFDYPAPDGTWLRATRFSALPQVQARQGWYVRAGDRVGCT